jgi:hypothetical protein
MSPSSSRGRLALNLAVSLLGVLLAGQLAAIGWALHRKHQQATRMAPLTVEPLASNPAPAPAPSTTSALPLTAATPVPAPAPQTPEPIAAPPADPFPIADERVRFFLGSALESREKGDMKAALTQLRAACDLQPGHPRLLYELATTYEKMSLAAKAAPLWDQLTAQGDGAGIYFKLAQARFEQGDTKPAREVETPLRLGKILERTLQEPPAGEALTLRIPVQALEGAVIDPGRVSVVTQFYDEFDGEVVETDAITDNHRWLSGEFPTWSTNSVEFLDQPYRRLPGEELGVNRRYHGYVVKLYYNDHLQDMVAKPSQLASRRAEPGERGLQQPAEILERRARPGDRLDDSLFPPLPH